MAAEDVRPIAQRGLQPQQIDAGKGCLNGLQPRDLFGVARRFDMLVAVRMGEKRGCHQMPGLSRPNRRLMVLNPRRQSSSRGGQV